MITLITKRNGHGQTNCVGCENKGKFALNWDSFLYTFNGKPYCLECLLEMLDKLNEENQELKRQYEKVLNDYCRLDAYNKTQQKERR